MDYRRLMGEIGYKSAGWVAPNQPEVLSAWKKQVFSEAGMCHYISMN